VRRVFVALATVVVLAGVIAGGSAGGPAAPTPGVLTQVNERLAAMGLNIRAEQIEFFTIGQSRPSNRVHGQEFRWVANDPRRTWNVSTDITYLVDGSDGRTASGLSSAQTEGAIDRSFDTWDAEDCMSEVDIVERADNSGDPDFFDSFFGFGRAGGTFADITEAGWLPRDFFEAVGGPGGGRGILAFSVSFIFVEEDGETPTDINGDNRLDTALNEVYYNDTFGDRRDDRAGNPWGIDVALPGIDVETVALHENGHSLGLGHFGPPPDAVMNPVYAGINHEPDSADRAGLCAVWSSWPN
jgi:hypothetical protein